MKRFLFSRPVGNSIRGIILLAMLLMSFGYGGANVAYAAPPIHDDFASAKTITGIEYHDLNVDTREATPTPAIANVDDPDNIPCPESGDPNRVIDYGYATVWYKYTPPENQAITLNTIGTNYDTFLAVWTGTRGHLTLVEGTCNDDTFEGVVSETGFIGMGGTTYYIEVAQFHPGTVPTQIGGNLDFNAFITNTQVLVNNNVVGSYFVPETSSLRRNLLNLNGGPMEVRNIAQNQTIVSERVIFRFNGISTSFSEMMGLPNNQLHTVYWLPWYTKNSTMNTQLWIANVSDTATTIKIFIGGRLMPGTPFSLAPKTTVPKAYTAVNRGPVKIVSTVSTAKIVVSERVIYLVNGKAKSSSELMALPQNQLNKVYWLPWYTNNTTMASQLRISNASGSTASIKIFIGGNPMPGTPFALAKGKTKILSYAGVNRGPVKIVSTVNILASERVIYKVNGVPVSYTEMMGLPNSQVDTTYWLPLYTRNTALNSQLKITNVSTSTARVHIYINGVQITSSPFNLARGATKLLSPAVIDKGPVNIVSNLKILASVRVIYKVSDKITGYSEMMALPNMLLDSKYWFPWYNNKAMNTQLRFALP